MSKQTTTFTGIYVTWAESASVLGVTPRAARDVIARYPKLCTPVRYGHRTVVLPLSGVLKVKNQRHRDAIKKGTK
jgi:hypothetical protein